MSGSPSNKHLKLAGALVLGEAIDLHTMTHTARPPHVALADHFADRAMSRHPLRIRLTSGEEFDCHAPFFDVDDLLLVVTTAEGAVRKVRPAEIEALFEHRPRWPAYASLGLVTVVPGAAISAFLVPLLSPLTAVDGALFGALGGVVAVAVLPSFLPSVSPFAYPRLLDRLGPLAYWRTVFSKADA